MDANQLRWRMGQVAFWTPERLRSFVFVIYHVIHTRAWNMMLTKRAGWRRGQNGFEALLLEEYELQQLELLITEIELAFHWKRFDFQREAI